MKNQLIFRLPKNRNYFLAANKPFNDERLSFGARGVLAYLLSKSDTWQAHRRDLVKRSPDGETKIKKYLSELTRYGYLRRLKERDKKGKIRWITEVYESPHLNPGFNQSLATGSFTTSGKTTGGKTTGGKTTGGKTPPLLNTDSEITEKEITEKEITDGTERGKSKKSNNEKIKITAAAAEEFFNSLENVSKELPKPLKAPETLIKELQIRGETAQTITDAWETCKAFAYKPAGAFIYWIKSGHLPQKLAFKARSGKEDPPQFRGPPPSDTMTEEEIKAELSAMKAGSIGSESNEAMTEKEIEKELAAMKSGGIADDA